MGREALLCNDDLLTIREMCLTFGVSPRTLRFYETSELLSPLRRGQHRLYDRRDRGRLKLILTGKRFGFSLEEIRQLLELYVPGDSNRIQIAATLDTARRHLARMRQQHDELAETMVELQDRINLAETMLRAQSAPDNPSEDALPHTTFKPHVPNSKDLP